MNLVKKLSVKIIKREIKALKSIKALLLLVSNLFSRLCGQTSLTYFLMRLVKKLSQRLCQAQDFKAIIKNKNLNMIFLIG